jgi:RimJ/RimL family protein N-acetyltransferase
MSVAPLKPPAAYARDGPYYLAAFDRLMAPLVAGWARDARELFWLAPSTAPPLTAAKVVGWAGPETGPRLFQHDGGFEPLGYLELNPMPGQPGHHWLGHCVIRPECRGTGLGRVMIELVLAEAFAARRGHRVSLMVFPENLGAYHCYLRTGFREVSDQYKYFGTMGRRYRMLQMSIGREEYELLLRQRAARAGSAPPSA